MDLDLAATATFVLVTTFTPGPNNILAASMGALYGYRRTVPFLLGVACGVVAVMGVCATVSSTLNAVLPAAAPYLRVVGAGYILWLAFGVYRSSSQVSEEDSDARPLRFINGFALQFVNPKAAFFGLTVYSVFLVSILGRPLPVLLSAMLLAAIAFSAISTWALGGQAIRRALRTPRRARALAVVLAGALVVTALDLVGLLPW